MGGGLLQIWSPIGKQFFFASGYNRIAVDVVVVVVVVVVNDIEQNWSNQCSIFNPSLFSHLKKLKKNGGLVRDLNPGPLAP
jgi:hypothetical protein